MRRTCLFSVVTALTAALVLFSVPVYADGKGKKCPKDAVCKPEAKTFVEKYVYGPKAKFVQAPAEPAKTTSAESSKPAPAPVGDAKPEEKKPVKPDPAPATEARPAPGPAPGKKEPVAAGALVVQEKGKPAAEPESKPAPAAATKPDDPKGSTPLTLKKPEKPVEPKGDDDLVSVHPGDVTAGAEAATNHGFQAGYTKGHADGIATAKKYRVMSREEVIKLSLDAAQKAIERRLGPSPEKKAP